MPKLVEASVAVYRFLLPVFPRELTNEFADSMLATFEQQVREAWRGSSFAGLAAIWLQIAKEVVTIGLPNLAVSLMGPALALLASSVIYGAVLWAVVPGSHCMK